MREAGDDAFALNPPAFDRVGDAARPPADIRGSQRARRPVRVMPVMPALIGLALASAPLLYGGNDSAAWGVNAILFGALLCLGEILSLRDGRAIPLRALRGPVLLFAAAFAWAAVQATPWAPAGWEHPAWATAAQALGRELNGAISVNPSATKLGLVRLLTAACVFWVCLQAAAAERGAKILTYGLALTTAAYALYGLVSFAVTPGQVLGLTVPSAKGVVTSTFISRNHYSTYAGLGVLLWLSLWASALRQAAAAQAPWRYRLVRLLEATFGALLPYVAGALVCAVALLLTGSRAGILATCGGVVAYLIAQSRGARAAVAAGPALAAVAAFAGLLYVLFGDVLSAHLAQQGFGDAGRLAAYGGEWRAILARPALGYGYATFADVFPQFRTEAVGVWGVWDRAHNTYLDLVIGLGLVAAASLVGAIFWLGVICWRGTRRRQEICYSALSVAALSLVGAHALVDFSMEIQGITLTLIAILAVGTAQSLPKREMVPLTRNAAQPARPEHE